MPDKSGLIRQMVFLDRFHCIHNMIDLGTYILYQLTYIHTHIHMSIVLCLFLGPAPALFKSKHICLRIFYSHQGDTGYFHTFRTTSTRLFNNIVINIRNEEEAKGGRPTTWLIWKLRPINIYFCMFGNQIKYGYKKKKFFKLFLK